MLFTFFQVLSFTGSSQGREVSTRNSVPGKIQYGTASFDADKFEGKKTANGEIFPKLLPTAHNSLALGTWIRTTNLCVKSLVVKVDDRLHGIIPARRSL